MSVSGSSRETCQPLADVVPADDAGPALEGVIHEISGDDQPTRIDQRCHMHAVLVVTLSTHSSPPLLLRLDEDLSSTMS